LARTIAKLFVQYFCFNSIHQLFTLFHFIFINFFASVFAIPKLRYRKHYFVLLCYVKLAQINVPTTKNIVLVHRLECFHNVDADIDVWFEVWLLANPLAGWSQLWIIFSCDNSQFDSKGFLDDNSFNINFVLMVSCDLLLKEREVHLTLFGHLDHDQHLQFFLPILPEVTNWWLTFKNLFENGQWSTFVSFLETAVAMSIAVQVGLWMCVWCLHLV
jgi:hypothetical protein